MDGHATGCNRCNSYMPYHSVLDQPRPTLFQARTIKVGLRRNVQTGMQIHKGSIGERAQQWRTMYVQSMRLLKQFEIFFAQFFFLDLDYVVSGEMQSNQYLIIFFFPMSKFQHPAKMVLPPPPCLILCIH
jgi:hypothetical protein